MPQRTPGPFRKPDAVAVLTARLSPAPCPPRRTTARPASFLALWREPRAEGVTRVPPAALGRVLGLDRSVADQACYGAGSPRRVLASGRRLPAVKWQVADYTRTYGQGLGSRPAL